MSRRRDLGDKPVWAANTVDIVCSNRNQHPRRILGKVELFGAERGTVTSFAEDENYNSFRDGFASKKDAETRSLNPLSPSAVAAEDRAIRAGKADPHMTDSFVCHQCGHHYDRRRDWVIATARTAHDRGLGRLDLSEIAAIRQAP
jgi:hypothetical protein